MRKLCSTKHMFQEKEVLYLGQGPVSCTNADQDYYNGGEYCSPANYDDNDTILAGEGMLEW